MSKMRLIFLSPKNEVQKILDIPMPEGIEWPAETKDVIDFTAKGEIFLVSGLQIEAINS